MKGGGIKGGHDPCRYGLRTSFIVGIREVTGKGIWESMEWTWLTARVRPPMRRGNGGKGTTGGGTCSDCQEVEKEKGQNGWVIKRRATGVKSSSGPGLESSG